MTEFRITNEHRFSEVGNVIDVLQRPRLWVPETDYPDYAEWLEKVEDQLHTDEKRAMLAYQDRNPRGTV
jgi:hypothetical protein